MSASPAHRKRAVIYIDGFNMYYGLLRGRHSGCKWLDLQGLFTRLRPDDDVRLIRYFTAFWPDSSGARHQDYVRALGASPLVSVTLGHFKRKELACRVRRCTFAGDRLYPSFEEKQTDVNIALAMLDDACQGVCDRMIVVTADSDLVPAIDLVRKRAPGIEIVLYVPGPRRRFQNAVELRTACHRARLFPEIMLSRFLLPDPVVLPGGGRVSKPAEW